MDRKEPISDETITKNATRQIAARGLRSPCHIRVQTRKGEVTLSGTVPYVHQRDAAVQAIRTVDGIRRVKEEIKVKPPPKPQYKELPPLEPAKEAAEPAVEESPVEAAPAAQGETSPEIPAAPEQPPADVSAAPAPEATDFDALPANLSPGNGRQPHSNNTVMKGSPMGIRQTRNGDSYTFECSSREEAERLASVLANYADWFKKHSWMGKPKETDEVYRVTFHVKSVIEFLRQEGF